MTLYRPRGGELAAYLLIESVRDGDSALCPLVDVDTDDRQTIAAENLESQVLCCWPSSWSSSRRWIGAAIADAIVCR